MEEVSFNQDNDIAAEKVSGSVSSLEESDDIDSSTDSSFEVDDRSLHPVGRNAAEQLDKEVSGTARESDRDYREITKDIISRTGDQLKSHNNTKDPLRKDLFHFIKTFLLVQYSFLCIILLGYKNYFNISDAVITTYIVSVFTETLAGLMVMIKFAFDTTQEVELIKILSSVVEHFQKFPNVMINPAKRK